MSLVRQLSLEPEVPITFEVQRRSFGQLSESERALVQNARFENRAPIEAWTAMGSNKKLQYATHGVFRYFGKFPPPIATHLITNYSNQGDLVLDPMCGSGTSGVECLLHNRKAILCDVNPLSVLLSKVKTTALNSEELQYNLTRILNSYKKNNGSSYSHYPIGLRNADHWFLPETIQSLRRLCSAIDLVKDDSNRNFFHIVLASIVRKVSRATTQQGRLFLDVATAEKDALPAFIAKANSSINAVSGLPLRTRESIQILATDARNLKSDDINQPISLTILHPPYFNSYRYSTINSLELAWLGKSLKEFRPEEIREYFKVGKPENVDAYLEDMRSCLNSITSHMKPGSTLALMIGDTVIRGNYIDVTSRLLDSMPDLTRHLQLIALRVPRHTEATWVASQRRNTTKLGITLCDFILVFTL